MKMNEIKSAAVVYFSSNISDVFAIATFSNSFDLWGDSDSLYDTSNDAYKAVIDRFVPAIKNEITHSHAIAAEYTSIVTTSNAATRLETNDTEKNTTATNTVHSAHSTDGHTQTQRQYPDGYTQAPDAAYIRAEVVDSPDTDTTDDSTTDTSKDTTTGAINSQTNNHSDTQTTDNIARANAINQYAPKLSALIEQCVFAFLGNTFGGCL